MLRKHSHHLVYVHNSVPPHINPRVILLFFCTSLDIVGSTPLYFGAGLVKWSSGHGGGGFTILEKFFDCSILNVVEQQLAVNC